LGYDAEFSQRYYEIKYKESLYEQKVIEDLYELTEKELTKKYNTARNNEINSRRAWTESAIN
jgi:hypothetical protein